MQMQLEALNRTIKLLAERDAALDAFGAPWRSMHAKHAQSFAKAPFEEKSQRVKYLIDTGYADLAQAAAKELATEALAEMGRTVCPYTGNHYFDEGCDCY